MKSTIKVTDVLGLPIASGRISIEDFELVQNAEHPNDNEKTFTAKVEAAVLGSGFKSTSCEYECLYRLPQSIVDELGRIYEVKNVIGTRGELKHIEKKISYSIPINLVRLRKLQTAQERCDEVNGELAEWLIEERDTYVRSALQDKLDRIHRIIDCGNEHNLNSLGKHLVNTIDDDERLDELKQQIDALKADLSVLRKRDLNRRKELCVEWVTEEYDSNDELKDMITKNIQKRNTTSERPFSC